eukprot:CAMPEP_0118973860 /NCGR_PEP_ID=MMETSP1173-20130426/10944_1 /TAXON_ID=1034831 /ORGANISM="Rhizochromulina marina cf, Strain CCMP1243" /LENGTH=511 /DNA_ID=CAMNT_0006923555 /DNA_START=13 /DNA_END=1548 /DNA_ORIENTATION=-
MGLGLVAMSLAVLSANALTIARQTPSRLRAARSYSRRTLLATAASDNHFDYLVIGGGSGGIASARRVAQWGKKAAVVEKSALGGTCVNVGCVPKKVMFNAAMVNEMLHASQHYGFTGVMEGAKFDWNTIKQSRDAYIARLNGIYGNNMANNDVTVISGLAAFSGPNSVQVGDETYTADHITIAVGGRTKMPDIPGIEHCLDSDGFFLLEEQPKRVAVIGAGYIAVELAGIFQALDSETSLFVRGERALRRFDSMLSETLDSEMKKAGMKVVPNSTPASVEKAEDGSLTLKLENGDEHGPFDAIIMAVGRQPLVDPLQLDKAGVTTNEGGYIQVDEFQNTATKGVYALGDVCGNIELTPMAIAAGRRLGDRLFGDHSTSKADYDMVPTVVFSHPTIGTIGLTEEEAKAKHGEDNVRVYKSTFTNLFYGPWQMPPEDKPKTAMKLVCLGAEEKVIGLHTIGMGSDELLQGFGVAMKMGATKADFDSCIAIHPTAAEEMVTMAPWGLKDGPKPQ